MILGVRAVSFLSSGLLVLSAVAQADELAAGRTARASSNCEAAYGPGFAAVEGGDACIFVGGHVRVSFGNRRGGDAPDNGWGNGGAVRVNAGDYPSDGAKPAAGHLRLPDGDAAGTIAR